MESETVSVIDQEITDQYAIYNGDCCEVLRGIPDDSIHLSIYSPPFMSESGKSGLYCYSSSERDLSNSRNYDEFFEHYKYVVKQIHRITMPGRISAVHCMDIPNGPGKGLTDFPGDIIRLHERLGFDMACRHFIWKEPLGVRNRTMARGLAHKQVVDDSSLCDVASADMLILFRKHGDNKIPVAHPHGLFEYSGARTVPEELLRYRGWTGKQTENRYSHWIWRQYASAFWDDVRVERVLPYKESRDPDDERHVHPLQLDVIERCVILRTNPGETVLTPFMGVGSEVYGALINDRRGIGIELKPSYYRQALKNVRSAKKKDPQKSLLLEDHFDENVDSDPEDNQDDSRDLF